MQWGYGLDSLEILLKLRKKLIRIELPKNHTEADISWCVNNFYSFQAFYSNFMPNLTDCLNSDVLIGESNPISCMVSRHANHCTVEDCFL